MNYYGAKELADSFRTVRKNTIQVAEDIPEDRYGFAPAEGTRSIGRTLVHIALSPQFQHTIHRWRAAIKLRRIRFSAVDEAGVGTRSSGENEGPDYRTAEDRKRSVGTFPGYIRVSQMA